MYNKFIDCSKIKIRCSCKMHGVRLWKLQVRTLLSVSRRCPLTGASTVFRLVY